MSRQVVFAATAALVASLLHGDSVGVASAAPSRSPVEIRQDLDTAEAQLRQGNHAAEPLERAFASLHQLRATDEQELRTVAMSFVLRGLVAAAEGRVVDAGIDWSAATAIAPELAQFDVVPYGAAGTALRRAADESRQIGARAVEWKTLGKYAPKLTRDARLHPPAYLKDCGQARVAIDIWLDESGRVRGFRNPEATCDRGLVLVAVSAIRERQYEPGKGADGKPVAAWLRVTVNFRMASPSQLQR